VDWIYGPLTNKKISYTHFDTTRNLGDSACLHRWAKRLYRILAHIEEQSGCLSDMGSLDRRRKLLDRDWLRAREQLEHDREILVRNMELDDLVGQAFSVLRGRVEGDDESIRCIHAERVHLRCLESR
jgi:hypothetical protein